jgi:membrane protein YqaA with SNARE-associated domain
LSAAGTSAARLAAHLTAHGIPWKKIGLWLVKAKFWVVAVMKPLGVWGILGLSLVDSAAIPLPFMDPLIVSYGVADHRKLVIYCLMAALGSAIGSMLPYYLGRAGGELFLLKRINRARYEALRNRFEKQEFLAIMLPAMCPPPMPVKVFELAAGVFEMRVASYFLAIASGKFLRFLIESILVIVYGPAVLSLGLHAIRHHLGLVLGGVGLVIIALALYVFRRVFDRSKGIALPLEDEVEPGS